MIRAGPARRSRVDILAVHPDHRSVPTPTSSPIAARARAVALGLDDLRVVGPISVLASAVVVVALLGGPATAAPTGGAEGGTAGGAPGSPVGAGSGGEPREGRGRGADGGKLDTIGVAPFGPGTLPSDLRSRLEESATAGLLATGARVATRASVAKAEAGAGLGSCGGDSGCLARLSAATGARLWLRGLYSTDGSTYHIHLDLFDPAAGGGAGAVVAARDDTCEICTEAEVGEMTNVAASALRASWRRSAGVPVAAAVARGRPPDGLAQSGGEGRATRITVTTSSGPAPVLASSKRPLWGQVLPVALLVAGAAAGGAGIYLAHENNRDTDYIPGATAGELVPRSRYDTGKWAIASFGAAAVLVGAAVTLFVLSDPGTSAASASASASASAGSWACPARADRALVRLRLAGTGLDLSGAF
jgi:hypothetical protein